MPKLPRACVARNETKEPKVRPILLGEGVSAATAYVRNERHCAFAQLREQASSQSREPLVTAALVGVDTLILVILHTYPGVRCSVIRAANRETAHRGEP
jgi:hypothetical protein